MRTDGITFVIPNSNQELHLPRIIRPCLASCAHLRTHELEAEILIVDNGSRDGSSVLLRQLEALCYDQGVHLLALAENCGRRHARNRALANATYRYVIFLGIDQEVLSKNLIHFYRSIRDTEAAVVYGNIMIASPQGTDFCSHESYLQARMLAQNYIHPLALLDAEQVAELHGYWDNAINVDEDWELYVHLAACGRRLVHVPIVFGQCTSTPSCRESCDKSAAASLIGQVYRHDPLLRESFHPNTRHLRYHPAVGYV
jgi:glycosyltransferase involved in cell wall biosynthesis